MEQAQERILVRGVNWLGDAVMTTPALLRLREARPEAFIALLTPSKLADLWRHHSAVDCVLPLQTGGGVFGVAHRLREHRFRTALILPNSPRSALESFLARIPRRVGYVRPWRRWLVTEAVAPRPDAVRMCKRSVEEIQDLIASENTASSQSVGPMAHQIHEYLHLAARLGAKTEPLPPQLAVTPEEVAGVRHRFGGSAGVGSQTPLFGLNPGAEYGPAKRWPHERFVAAAVEVHRRTGCHWWVFGGPADRELAESVAGEIRRATSAAPAAVRSLAGQTSLRELCAGLSVCELVLTNDTGPMHVAAAVGTRVIVPFGSTTPELTGPGLPGDERHRLLKSGVPCSPCFLRECPIDFRCMNGISVETVVTAVLQAAGGRRSSENIL